MATRPPLESFFTKPPATRPPLESFFKKPLETRQAEVAEAEKQAQPGLFGRVVPKEFPEELAKETWKTVVGGIPRFLASAAAAPVDLVRGLFGKQPLSGEFDIPTVGKARTFQAEAAAKQEEIARGDRPLHEGLTPFVEVPLAGLETFGAGKAAKTGVSKSTTAMSKLFGARAEKADAKVFEEAVEIVQPRLTPKLEAQAFKEGRVGTQGLFSAAPVKPSPQEARMAEAVYPLVKDGRVSAKAAPAVNQKAISTEVSRINTGVKAMLNEPRYRQPFNRGQLNSYLQSAKAQTKLVFAGDAQSEAAYDAVISEFKTYVEKRDVAGLFDARQEFDAFIKRRFPNTFKPNAAGVINPADNARQHAMLDVRAAANDMIADLLPDNNPYKAALRTEAQLLRAIENMSTKVRGITQQGKVSAFLGSRKGQVVKNAALTAGGATVAGSTVRSLLE